VTETQIEVQGNAALLEMVQETKKLVDLKVIVNEEDEFTPLRESLGNYTGLVGPKLLKAEMLKMLGTEVLAPKKKKKKSAVILEKDKKKDLVQLFIDAIKEKTMTMSEIRKENWNSSGATFNSPLKKLLEKGLIIKEGVKMIWKGPSDYVIQRSGRKIIY